MNIIRLSLVLCFLLGGCVSKAKYLEYGDLMWAKGYKEGTDDLFPLKAAYNQCIDDMKDYKTKYNRIYGNFIKEQNEARTDK